MTTPLFISYSTIEQIRDHLESQGIAGWLAPTGSALIEIGTPWYPASVDGRGWQVG